MPCRVSSHEVQTHVSIFSEWVEWTLHQSAAPNDPELSWVLRAASWEMAILAIIRCKVSSYFFHLFGNTTSRKRGSSCDNWGLIVFQFYVIKMSEMWVSGNGTRWTKSFLQPELWPSALLDHDPERDLARILWCDYFCWFNLAGSRKEDEWGRSTLSAELSGLQCGVCHR